jgi:hypothetical protein
MNVRFQVVLPEADHGELRRHAAEPLAPADIIRLGLRWVLANRDVLHRLPPPAALSVRDHQLNL